MNCDERLTRGPVSLAGEFKGERFVVEMEGVRCLACDFATIEGKNSAEFSRRLADAYRSQHGLLTSEQIKSARVRMRMTQAQFAEYLNVGIASVKRWELGQVQDPAMDELIRLKTDVGFAEQNLSILRRRLMIQPANQAHDHRLAGEMRLDFGTTFYVPVLDKRSMERRGGNQRVLVSPTRAFRTSAPPVRFLVEPEPNIPEFALEELR